MLICLLCNVFINSVSSFNIDSKDTLQEYSIPDKNLQFGYTVNFLRNNRLIVGAPPIDQSDSSMVSGAVYSCDVGSKVCKKVTDNSKPLVPASTSRCFLPPYNGSCSDTGSSQTTFWYYDPLYTTCKSFTPACRKQVVKQNIFVNKKSCVDACKRELADRIAAAKQTGRASYCSVTFQNLHAGPAEVLQKDHRGEELSYYLMKKGEVKILNIENDQVCGIPFVAKSGKSSEYLYFIDVDDNSFDAVLTPQDGAIVSIGTMEQIRMAFYGKNTPKMGLSVHTSQDQVIACEPQYNRKYVGSVGRCSMYKNDSLQYDVIPLEEKLRKGKGFQWWQYGTSVGGFSSTHIPDAPSVFFTSAPNTRKGIGFLAALSSSNGKILGSQLNPMIRTEAYLGPDSYFGYSLSAGRLQKLGFDSVIEGRVRGNIASGSPRGGMKREGYVLLMQFSEHSSDKFQLLERLEDPDEQIGHYFGSSVCIVDLNNDGRDDVLVGSPYYTKMRDEGRVYVYMNKKGRDDGGYAGVELKFTLEGEPVVDARFGTTIANIGDINKDGFNDVAVGAPGGERGAVYIFNGNAEGINPKYSQLIGEADIPNIAQGFGISISGGFDVNGDSYNDIAVGGHIGRTVYVFKSKPIIVLQRIQSVNATSVPYKSDSSNCMGPDKEEYHCVKLMTLISYSGEGTPDTFSVDVTFNMDVNKVSKRAKIIDAGALVNKRTDKVILQRGVEKLISQTIYVKVEKYGIKVDLFTPITQVTSYKESGDVQLCGQSKLCSLLPKVEDTTTSLGYAIKCSNASYCKPYLRVTLDLQVTPEKESRKSKIIYGVTKRIILTAHINNTGETAYQPKLVTRFRSDMEVNTAKWGDRSLQWEISNIKPDATSDNDRELAIILPSISAKSQLAVVVQLSLAKRKPTTLLPYTFTTTATALDIEKTPQRHNTARVSAPVAIETCKHVKQASAEPSPIVYNPLTKPAENEWRIDDGEAVLYSYYVRNSGQNSLDSLLVNVSMVDEVVGVRFMCIQSIIVDQVHCKDFVNCDDFLKRRNEKKPKTTEGRNRHFVHSKCRINSIEVGKGATIRVKAVYFADALGKLSKYSDVYFPDSSVDVGKLNTTFTPTVTISHDDAFASLHYQRTDCPRDKTATVTFIKVEPQVKKDVPPWTYAISVIAALFLLLCIILILRKYGFFKKNIKEISAPLTEHEIGDGDEEEEEEM